MGVCLRNLTIIRQFFKPYFSDLWKLKIWNVESPITYDLENTYKVAQFALKWGPVGGRNTKKIMLPHT